jgi:hypothetical protein
MRPVIALWADISGPSTHMAAEGQKGSGLPVATATSVLPCSLIAWLELYPFIHREEIRIQRRRTEIGELFASKRMQLPISQPHTRACIPTRTVSGPVSLLKTIARVCLVEKRRFEARWTSGKASAVRGTGTHDEDELTFPISAYTCRRRRPRLHSTRFRRNERCSVPVVAVSVPWSLRKTDAVVCEPLAGANHQSEPSLLSFSRSMLISFPLPLVVEYTASVAPLAARPGLFVPLD